MEGIPRRVPQGIRGGIPWGIPREIPQGIPQEIPTHPHAFLVASDLVFTRPLTPPVSYPAAALNGQMTSRPVNYLSGH